MAENITRLNTRIISKHITLAQANSGTWTPYEGEIVLARVDTQKPDGHGGVVNVPTYLMKVGAKDGNGNLIAIKDLQWAHAPASDVYAWAKQQKLAIITNGSGNVISNIEATDAGITITKVSVATSTDKETLENAISALESALGTEKSDREAADSALDGRVSAIETSLKDGGTIHELIDTAQAQADKGVADAAKAQKTVDDYKVANDAVVATLATQNALDAAVAGLDAAYKAADNTLNTNLTAAIATAKSEAISTASADATSKANAAESAAKSDAATNLAAAKLELEGEISALGNTVSALDSAYKAADTALDGRIGTLEAKVANVTNVMDFVGAVNALPESTEGYQNGDVIVVTQGDNAGKEYVVSDGAFVEFGSTSATDNAVAALGNRVDALETFKNTTVPDTYATIANLEAETSARTSADNALGGRIDGVEADYKAADSALETKLTSAIATAKGEAIAEAANKDSALHTTISKEIDDDIAAIATTLRNEISAGASGAESNAKSYTDTEVKKVDDKVDAMDTAYKAADSALDGRVKKIEDDYLKAADKTALQNNINTVSTNLETLSNTVSANKSDVDTNFLKATADGNITLNGITVIFDCGGVEA